MNALSARVVSASCVTYSQNSPFLTDLNIFFLNSGYSGSSSQAKRPELDADMSFLSGAEDEEYLEVPVTPTHILMFNKYVGGIALHE